MPSPLVPLEDLASAVRQGTSTSKVAHRPWPLPERFWVMGQSWIDLLFAHWRVDAERLRRVIPTGLELEEIDGSAWIGITPFEVRALRARFTLPAPVVSAFPELNVRTYVTVDGKPGLYFLSLDADSRFAVAAARRTYRFPYFHARMSVRREGETIEYGSERVPGAGPAAAFRGSYGPLGEAFEPVPGSLERKLIERYCAYTLDEKSRVLRAEIHHRPWRVHEAEAEISDNTMTVPFGIELEGEPLLHMARPQDVAIWPHEIAADRGG
ncbi:MAG TPA: DUF2071 domain-containing protein [Solirubrobacterales bacterium]|nr:DUF2071 domain-containing protein [Solirubrobacterales bacterium]